MQLLPCHHSMAHAPAWPAICSPRAFNAGPRRSGEQLHNRCSSSSSMLHSRRVCSSSSSAASLSQPCHSNVRAKHITCRCTASSSSRMQRMSVSSTAAAAASTYVLSVAVAPGSDSDAQGGQQPSQQQACRLLQREHERLTHLSVRKGDRRPQRLHRCCVVLLCVDATHIPHRPADPTHRHKPNTTTTP